MSSEWSLWFTARPSSSDPGRLPYVGRLDHADFSCLFKGIEPEDPAGWTDFCETEEIVVVGCDPFTDYSDIERLVPRSVGSTS